MPARRHLFRHMISTLPPGTWRAWVAACLLGACSMVHAASISGLVTDRNNTPLSDAVIYAVPAAAASPAKPARGAVIDQVNKEFVPYVTPVQTGTAIIFPNKDNIRHHVYSFSPAKTFELRLYSGVPASPVLFDKPGAVVLGCNIHDWMLAYVYVVDTPYFAKTVNGNARIDGLPAGEYELRTWHPQLRGPLPSQQVRAGTDGATAVRVTLDLLPKPPQGGAGPAVK